MAKLTLELLDLARDARLSEVELRRGPRDAEVVGDGDEDGRRTCSACQASLHVVFHPPRVADTCDDCGAALIERPDDCPAVVSNRVQVYLRQTAPLIVYYAARGVLQRVDGDRPIDVVATDVQRRLAARRAAA